MSAKDILTIKSFALSGNNVQIETEDVPGPSIRREHTPGPWRYLEDAEGDRASLPLTVCDTTNNDLANVYSREDATVDISREAAIANARLIAAAPELLAALEYVSQLQDDIIENAPADVVFTLLRLKVDCARAAIAKATGAQ